MTEVAKQQMCILMRSGIQLWIDKDRTEALMKMIGNESKFVSIDEQYINTADVSGIYDPTTMEDLIHRKNGQWKCKHNVWHDRFEKCGDDCIDEVLKKSRAKSKEDYFKKYGVYPLPK